MRIIRAAKTHPPSPPPCREGGELRCRLSRFLRRDRTRRFFLPLPVGRGLGGGFLLLGALAALPAAEPARPLAPTAVTWEKSGAFLGEVPSAFPKHTGAELSVAPGVLK